MTDNKSIGENLRIVRKKLSQKKFGESVGVSRSYVSDIEHGRIKPSLEYLINVAEKYEVSLDWILLNRIAVSASESTIALNPNSESDLDLIITYLRELWTKGDADVHGWIKIQFKESFPKYDKWTEKKSHVKNALYGA
jgi:transcriptional regulator with XRE-family HTH domain